MANTSTMKKFGSIGVGDPMDKSDPSRTATQPNRPAKYVGQYGSNEKFAEPLNPSGITAKIRGMEGLHNDIGESSGFITEGYLDKNHTPYGEAAKFNFLPPGMDISNQENAEINEMPMRILVAESYPGDGWSPTPRDIPE